jgi:hypothetical protein
MSYFKPLNSNENNLHIIRSTISGNGTILYPSINQLPSTFNITSIPSIDGNSTILTVNYNNVFNSTDIPTVFLNVESSLNDNSTTNEIVSPILSYNYSQNGLIHNPYASYYYNANSSINNPNTLYYYNVNSSIINGSTISNLIANTLDTANIIGNINILYDTNSGILTNPTNNPINMIINYNLSVSSSNIWSYINITDTTTNSILDTFIPSPNVGNISIISHAATITVYPSSNIIIQLLQNDDYYIGASSSINFKEITNYNLKPNTLNSNNSLGNLDIIYDKQTGIFTNPTNNPLTCSINYNFTSSNNKLSNVNIINTNTYEILEHFVPPSNIGNIISHNATIVLNPYNSMMIQLFQNDSYYIETASYINVKQIDTSNISNLMPNVLDPLNTSGTFNAIYDNTTGILTNQTIYPLTLSVNYNFKVNNNNLSSINITDIISNKILEQYIPPANITNISHTATVVLQPLSSIVVQLLQNDSYYILANNDYSPSYLRFTQLDYFIKPIKSLYVSDKYNSYCNIYGQNITTTEMPTIDLLIVGTRPTGPVFAVSNRGWKYATNITNDNLLYSDMKVGINTDNPLFNLSHNGNIGFSTNILSTTNIIPNNLLNNYLNVVNIDDANVIVSMPGSIQNGQLLDITIGQINIKNRQLEIDITSNILNSFGTNLLLRSVGDTVSLMGYNNQWLIINKQITPLASSVVNNYNNLYTSTINYDLLLNGYLNILNFDSTTSTTINLPSLLIYDGVYVDIVVGQKDITNTSNVTFLMGNIIASSDNMVLNNISDRIKFIGLQNKWLLIQSHLS